MVWVRFGFGSALDLGQVWIRVRFGLGSGLDFGQVWIFVRFGFGSGLDLGQVYFHIIDHNVRYNQFHCPPLLILAQMKAKQASDLAKVKAAHPQL